MLSMIAVVPGINPAVPPCPIKWVGRRGLSVSAVTYCGNTVSVGDGVSQVPSHTRVCTKCEAAISAQYPAATTTAG